MCQILALTTHNPAKRDAIILSVWKAMYVANQRDGYGAAWFAPDGSIGYYKAEAPVLPTAIVPACVKRGFHQMRNIPSDGGFLIIHGRVQTNKKCVENTHPMLEYDQDEETILAAMIHNGVITSVKYTNVNSTCDSELLLQAYRAGGIQECRDYINGRYAFMMIDHSEPVDAIEAVEASEGVEAVAAVAALPAIKRLHICKDNTTTTLHMGGYRNGDIDGVVIATTSDLIHKVNGEYWGEIEDSHVLTFTGPTAMEDNKFDPHKRTYVVAAKVAPAQQHQRHTFPNDGATDGEVDDTDVDKILEEMERAGDAFLRA